MRKPLLFSAALLAAAAMLPTGLQAQTMSIFPIPEAGPAQDIFGSGAGLNSPVELFINGVPSGQAVASSAPGFEGVYGFFGVPLNEGDVLHVQNQESWYFNEDGNSQGWNDNSGGAGGTVTVAGGSLTYTVTDPGPNPSLLITTLNHPTDSLRVLEFRLRNPGTTNLIWVSTNDGVTGPPASSKACQVVPGSDWQTYVFPLVETGNTLPPGTSNFWLYLQFSGATADDELEFDYIRVREYIDWHFENGDTMGWGANVGFPGGLSVVDGKLTGIAANGLNRIIYNGPWTDVIDDANITVLEVSNSSTTAAAPWGSQFTWSDDNDGNYGAWNTVAGTPPGDGTTAIITHDLLTPLLPGIVDVGDWGPNVNSNMLYVVGGMEAENDILEIDYMRLRPVTYAGPSAPVAVLAAPTDASIDVDVASLNFGTVETGTTSAGQTVTITNDGDGDNLTVDLSITGTDAAAFTIVGGNNSPYTIAQGANEVITITFSPTADQASSATLVVDHDAPGQSSPIEVALEGIGEDPPSTDASIDVDVASLNFGTVETGTTSTGQTVTITNNGDGDNLIVNLAITGTDAAAFTIVGGNNSPYTIAQGANEVITITFSPTADQAYSATLEVTHDAPGQTSPVEVALAGTGETTPTPEPVYQFLRSFDLNVGVGSAALAVDFNPVDPVLYAGIYHVSGDGSELWVVPNFLTSDGPVDQILVANDFGFNLGALRGIQGLAVDEDSNIYVAGDNSSATIIRKYSPNIDKTEWTINGDFAPDTSVRISGLDYAGDGLLLAAATNAAPRFLNAQTGATSATLPAGANFARDAAFNRNNNDVYVRYNGGYTYNDISLWTDGDLTDLGAYVLDTNAATANGIGPGTGSGQPWEFGTAYTHFNFDPRNNHLITVDQNSTKTDVSGELVRTVRIYEVDPNVRGAAAISAEPIQIIPVHASDVVATQVNGENYLLIARAGSTVIDVYVDPAATSVTDWMLLND